MFGEVFLCTLSAFFVLLLFYLRCSAFWPFRAAVEAGNRSAQLSPEPFHLSQMEQIHEEMFVGLKVQIGRDSFFPPVVNRYVISNVELQ